MIKQARQRIGNIAELVLMVLLVVMCIVLFLQVVCRYVFNSPLVWSEELARYLFIWITFIGMGYGVLKHLHIDMSIVYTKFPKKIQKIIQVLVNLFIAGCYGYILPASLKLLKAQHVLRSTTLPVQLSFVVAAVPVGCCLLIVCLIIDTICTVMDIDGTSLEILSEG